MTSITLLIDRLTHLITLSTNTLASNLKPMTSNRDLVQRWYDQVASQLARYAAAAFMTGNGTTEITNEEKHLITGDLAAQLDYLRHFADVIEQSEGDFQAGWKSRAQSYARSIKVPYWRGATKMLPLPAMPGQGSQCLTQCKCSWDIQQLEGDNNYDCYWRMGAAEHCQTCVTRAQEWAPFKIRNGEVQ